jgi:predicted transcriptional regulator
MLKRKNRIITQTKSQDLKEFIKKGLTKSEYQLFFYLLSEADDTNTIRLENNEVLASKLETTTRSITRAITNLVTYNLIKSTKNRGGRTYMINPDYFYNSKTPFILMAIYDSL